MRAVEKKITELVCDTCGYRISSSDRYEAEQHEAKHRLIGRHAVGGPIVWWTDIGGHDGPYPMRHAGVVVRLDAQEMRLLAEDDDGSRSWVYVDMLDGWRTRPR